MATFNTLKGLSFWITLMAMAALSFTPQSVFAEEEEIDLLGGGGDDAFSSGAFEMDDDDDSFGDIDSFGLELEMLDFEATWSAYGDAIHIYQWEDKRFTENADFAVNHPGVKARPDPSKNYFDAYHFNPIMGARMGKNMRAELEMEFEHSGAVQKIEYSFIDYSFDRALTVRIGKFIVPLGRFNDDQHPSFRWTQVTRPKMMKQVIPAIWADTGLLMFGKIHFAEAMTFSYDLYAINGLGYGKHDAPDHTVIDYMATQSGATRKLRGNKATENRENNRGKTVGIRLTLDMLEDFDFGATEVGLSANTGAYDTGDHRKVSFTAVDFHTRLGEGDLRGEWATSYYENWSDPVGESKGLLDPYEQGFYVQYVHKIGKWRPALRYDQVLSREGKSNDATEGDTEAERFAEAKRFADAKSATKLYTAFVPSIMYAADVFWSLRTELTIPFYTTENDLGELEKKRQPMELQTMIAFNF